MKTIALVLAMAVPAAAQDKVRQETEAKLKSVRVTLDFRNAPLEAVTDYLREIAAINLVLDPKVREKNIVVTLKVSEIALGSALTLILKPHACGVLFRDGVLQVLPQDRIDDLTLRMELYDCRDILYPIRDFPGVDFVLSEGLGVTTVPDIDPEGATFAIEELVKAHTGAKSWDENPKVSCRLQNGILVVKQTPEVHRQVVRLLNLLRRFK